ncbi:hypothetical protein [Microbacterium sp. P02]|uniref:hypothetical protein n=1 Tax=unclassified Microbacterium TaxID=2609290 RepID=UPI00366E858E
MHSPYLYFAGERLSRAELSAARLDGHLVEVGDAYIPADAVETRGLRAGSLVGLLGATLAATHLSAAWIHGALPEPPSRHTVQRAVQRRVHRVPSHHIVYRDLQVAESDLQRLGGVSVTSPVRTLADLTRVDDPLHRRVAQSMIDSIPSIAADAIVWLENHRSLPGKKDALTYLRASAGEAPDPSAMTTSGRREIRRT